MKFDSQKHHRQSIRLPGYDYNQAGVYFVTIVTWQKDCLFGEIAKGIMSLSPVGQMVQNEWQRLSQRFKGLVQDEFVVMPNHIHGVVILTGDNFYQDKTNDHVTRPDGQESFPSVKPGSLAAIVRAYKSSTTLRFNRTRFAQGALLWQRNYYEHIVRHDQDLNRIRRYIQENPFNWTTDEENRANPASSK